MHILCIIFQNRKYQKSHFQRNPKTQNCRQKNDDDDDADDDDDDNDDDWWWSWWW